MAVSFSISDRDLFLIALCKTAICMTREYELDVWVKSSLCYTFFTSLLKKLQTSLLTIRFVCSTNIPSQIGVVMMPQ